MEENEVLTADERGLKQENAKRFFPTGWTGCQNAHNVRIYPNRQWLAPLALDSASGVGPRTRPLANVPPLV